MSADVVIARVQRGPDELRVTLEPHPRTGRTIVMLAHVRADGSMGPRAPLQASEIDQVVHALQIAAQTLRATKRPQHRTISAADQLEEDRKLF